MGIDIDERAVARARERGFEARVCRVEDFEGEDGTFDGVIMLQLIEHVEDPARVAERIATLDLVSHGRIDFGTGESSSLAELGGFGVPVEKKREQWRECVEEVCKMMVMEPYPGHRGEAFSMPVRNVVPKPVQKPHPPLWVACSNRETIKLAARLGMAWHHGHRAVHVSASQGDSAVVVHGGQSNPAVGGLDGDSAVVVRIERNAAVADVQ